MFVTFVFSDTDRMALGYYRANGVEIKGFLCLSRVFTTVTMAGNRSLTRLASFLHLSRHFIQ